MIRSEAEPPHTPNTSGRPVNAVGSPAFVREITSLALAKLANQRRVYDRLDWWPLEAWRSSDGLIAIAADVPSTRQSTASLSAALLIVPMALADGAPADADLDGPAQLHRSASPVGWLRWCAVAEGQSPSVRLAQLLEEAAHRCRRVGITELWCLSEPQGWLGSNLRDLGFKRREELITLSLTGLAATHRAEIEVQSVPGALLRVVRPNQIDAPLLHALQTLDQAAFGPPWHYSKHVLRQALAEARYTTVAELRGQIVGYQCTLFNEDARGAAGYSYGHVTRLAVQPHAQHRGLGRWLFADALRELFRLGAAEVTLNTLSSNVIAQKFYRQFGFVPLPDRMAVLSSPL